MRSHTRVAEAARPARSRTTIASRNTSAKRSAAPTGGRQDAVDPQFARAQRELIRSSHGGEPWSREPTARRRYAVRCG